MCRERLWRRASFSKGALLGKLEWSSYTRDFERRMKEGSRKGASVSIGTPLLGNIGGRSFPGAFDRKAKCLYLVKFFMLNLRDM